MALSSDARLAARVRRGDEAAFEALHARHAPAILSFCRHLTGNREDAEDAVQHSFLALYRRIVESNGGLDLRPWLFTVARNRCLSLLRARREGVKAAPDAGIATSFDGLAAEVERRQELRDLVGDMARLPEPQRAALVLSQLDALSYREIGGVLEVSPEQVKALVFQARSSLASTREAREAPCFEIRRQISDARGAALRRRLLRRHVRQCDGCREFEAIVLRQRREIAILLPVAPSAGLAGEILRGALGREGAATAAGGGAVVGAGGAGVGGGIAGSLGALGAGGAAKLAVVAVVGAGGVAVAAEVPARIQDGAPSQSLSSGDRADRGPAERTASGEAAPYGGPAAERLPSSGRGPGLAVGDGEQGAAERTVGQGETGTTGPGADAHAGLPGALSPGEIPSGETAPVGGSGPQEDGDGSAGGPDGPPDLPPGLAKKEQLPPGLAKRDELPPGLAKRGAAPPGQSGKPAGGNGNGGGGGNGNGNAQAPASPGGGNGQGNGVGGSGDAGGGPPASPGSAPQSGGGPPSAPPGNGNGGQGNGGAGNGNGGQGNGAAEGNGGGAGNGQGNGGGKPG